MSRLDVRKTYKLYIGGTFPRSESGRSYEVVSASGEFLANAAMGSRKDVRDAVVAARGALAGWSGATAYNRGQVLYRVAEVLELHVRVQPVHAALAPEARLLVAAERRRRVESVERVGPDDAGLHARDDVEDA